MRKKAVTLLELTIVMIVVGILAAMAIPNYFGVKESTLDKDASANLKLIIAAEKIYHLENGAYYNSSNITDINNNLKLSLPQGDKRNWDYRAGPDPLAVGGACAQASRYNVTNPRSWYLNLTIEEPQSGNCT